MLADYVSAGFDPQSFWGLTPAVYLAVMRGTRKRLLREKHSLEWHVWHAAYLGRVKKFPTFEGFTGRRQRAAPLPWQQQLAAWQSFAATNTEEKP